MSYFRLYGRNLCFGNNDCDNCDSINGRNLNKTLDPEVFFWSFRANN